LIPFANFPKAHSNFQEERRKNIMATAAFSGLYESIRPAQPQETGFVGMIRRQTEPNLDLRFARFRTLARLAAFVMVLALILGMGAQIAAAQESVLYNFGVTSTDVESPASNLIFDSKGNLYGTSQSGGAHSYGTVFELSPGTGGVWTEKILYSFAGELAGDAGGPIDGLVFDAQGNLYGVTSSGGVYGYGAVYELSPQTGGVWTEKVIRSFDFSTTDGSTPAGSLAIDANGNLYGAATAGGAHFGGVIYELSPAAGGAWTESVLYNFGASGDAGSPVAGPIFDKSGNLFGSTYSGGSTNGGAVYELSPGAGGSWTEKVIHTFPVNSTTDGWEGNGPLIFDSAGNLYGTTNAGGHEFGTVFEMTPLSGGTWSEKLIWSFNPTDANPDGEKPAGNLLFDSKGNLYGITTFSEGGAYSGFGLIYKLTPQANGAWTRLILHDFTGDYTPEDVALDGTAPKAGLVMDASGNFYGTTGAGGIYAYGTFYVLGPESAVAAPVFSPVEGTYSSPQTITITDATPGATIYYSNNGTPDTTSTVYTGPFIVSTSQNLAAFATAPGLVHSSYPAARYVITPTTATPVFSPAAGTYTSAQTVTISDATSGATIYYTTNGTTPTTSSTKYTAAITVSATETLEAIAVASGKANSAVASATYTIQNPTAATPVFSPAVGTYTSAQSVTITDSTAGAVIYYTINGTTPTTSSTKYTGAITVSATETIEALAVATGYTNSAVASGTYTITPPAATPVFAPVAGTYTAAQSVTITDSTAGATIYYTTNGTTPTTSSTKYTGAIPVTATETIKAIATATGYSSSATASATYTINLPIAATPVFSPVAGTYDSVESVTISDATPGAAIYYTTNGTMPSASSTRYTGAITVSQTETIEAIAIAAGYANSTAASATYTITLAVGNSQVSILYSFNSELGCPGFGLPSAPIFDAKGNLYGTCNGVTGGGEVYELTPRTGGGWTESVIYNNEQTLGNPNPGLIFDAAKVNLYGTENSGGSVGAGSVYELSPAAGGAWTLTTLHSFQNGTADGQAPAAGMIFDAAGNLYGTTDIGGANNEGTVFKLTPASGGTWTESILYSFGASSTDGINPKSSLLFDSKGNLYGSTYGGGGTGSFGTIFELSPSTGGAWTEKVLQSFSITGTPDGQHPLGTMVFDTAGNLYGVTASGGSGGGGTFFELSPSTGGAWTTTVLHNFANNGTDGASPDAGLSMDSKGNIYGTTASGGVNRFAGTIYKMIPSTGTWTENVLYSFSQTDDIGYTPATTLTLDASGNLYGITTQGGLASGGTLFEFNAIPLAATPTFSPAAGTYSTAQSVTITDATPGAVIYYTTNGTTPTTASTKYTGAITVSATETIEAIAVAAGYTNSAVASANYVIVLPAAKPVFSPVAGTYASAQSVTITDSTAGASIYYTTNGTTPTTASTKYTAAIAVSATETIEAIAVAAGYANSAVASATYTIGVSATGALQFIPVTPCRIVDTRNATGAFGGPELAAAATRSFDVPQSGCGIPSTAVAYSLNVTVVPIASLGYLSIWPAGEAQPTVSTLNSTDGRVKANATITPAGASGGVSVYASDATQFILDIDGYFVPAGTSASGLEFYPLTPCRIADTRNPTGALGGPSLAANTGRAFPVQSSGCGIPSTAKAYSLNITAVPHNSLGFLTAWPSGEAQPVVSTLNATTGAVTANAAIVPAGTSGDVSIVVSDSADVILDINGYFAPPATGGLSLYTVTPCRVVDTRNGAGAFDGTLAVPVRASSCAPPATAQAYVLNATVVPTASLSYLTLWAAGGAQPDVSTLNAIDGAVTSNMAIVPTTNGSIDAFSTDATNLLLDLSSYFAP
jgi:uncharacterized repeat protein (TIGR03803 family)